MPTRLFPRVAGIAIAMFMLHAFLSVPGYFAFNLGLVIWWVWAFVEARLMARDKRGLNLPGTGSYEQVQRNVGRRAMAIFGISIFLISGLIYFPLSHYAPEFLRKWSWSIPTIGVVVSIMVVNGLVWAGWMYPFTGRNEFRHKRVTVTARRKKRK